MEDGLILKMITKHYTPPLWKVFGGYLNKSGIEDWSIEDAELCPIAMVVILSSVTSKLSRTIKKH